MDRVNRQHESDSNRTAAVREDQEPGRVSATAAIQRASASAPASVGPAQGWTSSVAPVGDAAARAHGLVPFDPGAPPAVQMQRDALAQDLDQLDAQSDGDIADDLVHDADRMDEARGLYEQGQAAHQAGDYVRAGQLFEQAAIANRAERRSAIYNAAVAYGRALTARGGRGGRGRPQPPAPTGQLSQADLDALGESPGESAGVIADRETGRDDFNQGLADYGAGNDAAAAQGFERAGALVPEAAGDSNYNAGMAHFRGGNYEGAVRAFRAALGLAAPAAAGAPRPGGAPVQRHADGANDADEHVHQLAEAGFAGGGGALPHLDAIQRSFGHHDIGDVVAHVGGAADDAARGMGARAYASGNQVAFASSPDLHLAAHEAAHVVQQRGGVQLKGGVGEAGDAYEQHADAVADRVVRGESAADLLDEMSGGGAAVQRAVQRDGEGTEGRAASPRVGQRGGRAGDVAHRSNATIEIGDRRIARQELSYVTVEAKLGGSVELQAPRRAGGGESGGDQEPDTEVNVGPRGSIEGDRGAHASVVHHIRRRFYGFEPQVQGDLEVTGNQARLGMTGTLETSDGPILLPDHFEMTINILDWEREEGLRIATAELVAELNVPEFDLEVAGHGLCHVVPHLQLKLEFQPNYRRIFQQLMTRFGSQAAGGAIEGGAGASAGAAAAESAAVTDAALAGAGGSLAAPVLAAAVGVAAGVLSVMAVIDELENARELVEFGDRATRSLYYYCISYTGTYLGAGSYGGNDGQAGRRAAMADMQAIARLHNVTVEQVTAAANQLGARRLYGTVFDGAKPRYRDAAAERVGSVVRYGPLIDGQLDRAKWGHDWFNRLGGSHGMR